MRRFLSLFIVLFFTFGLIINDAEAKRFGGGRSFGVQRSVSSFSRSKTPSPGLSRPGMQTNKWLGPLAGLALGGLLASLFMGHGLGTGILTWLILGLAFFAILNLFRKKTATQAANYSLHGDNFTRESKPSFMNNPFQQTNHSPYPYGFDEDAFLRDAKVCFLRLQTAYDTKNLNDLREFTTPEVFAEIQIQLQERGDEENQTDVVSLNTELLDAAADQQTALNSAADSQIASVRFSGQVCETADKKISTGFNEIWHFRKSPSNSRWLVAGIQQQVH